MQAADHSRRFRFLDAIVAEGRIQAREDQERGRCLLFEIAINRQATRVFTFTCLASELSVQLRAPACSLLLSAEDPWTNKTVTKQRSNTLPLVLVLYAHRIPPHQPELTPSQPLRFFKASSRSQLRSRLERI